MVDVQQIVIESSPILLIHALLLSKSGKSVVLIVDPVDKGGCWRTCQIDDFEVELCCHLLESFRYSHNVLKQLGLHLIEYTDEEFPVRLSGDTLSTFSSRPYHTRWQILSSFVGFIYSHTRRLCFYLPKLIVNYCRPASYSLHSYIPRFYLSHHLFQLLRLQPLLKHPNGWSGLMSGLWSLVDSTNSIEVVYDNLKSVDDINNMVYLESEIHCLEYFSIALWL